MIFSDSRSTFCGICLDKSKGVARLSKDAYSINVLQFHLHDKLVLPFNWLTFIDICSGISLEGEMRIAHIGKDIFLITFRRILVYKDDYQLALNLILMKTSYMIT